MATLDAAKQWVDAKSMDLVDRAAGTPDELALTAWIRRHIAPSSGTRSGPAWIPLLATPASRLQRLAATHPMQVTDTR
jgi:hypothetical protein